MGVYEWIKAHFPFDEARGVFRPAEPGEYTTEFPVEANLDQFVEWFGGPIGAALSSGGSLYDALTDGTVQQRGWRPIFDLWKAKGIID